MKIKNVIIFLSLFIIPIQTVNADTPTIDNKGWKGRKTYAILLMKHIEKIDQCFPELTPDEKQWLDHEFEEYKKNNNVKRFYLNVKKSKIFKIHKIKECNKIMNSALHTICDETLPEINEIKIWLIIASSLMESEYWQFIYDFTIDGIIEKEITFNNEFTEFAIYDKETVYHNNGIVPSRKILQAIFTNY
ncbi:hypothetical protein DSCW_60300 [Desulfosarcina widdelii]|uniref:Uncharacterized protein n=1 Tax=Desulfosarcina widdelii TaxID=947919 RepID=A0A5K7ZFX1_9BACT|nr:hypothetical protein [Desulfosarcina widdelii]BBO78613.1 hypothetical protein DSCW_60300 [Desulfosarcina widdelii]